MKWNQCVLGSERRAIDIYFAHSGRIRRGSLCPVLSPLNSFLSCGRERGEELAWSRLREDGGREMCREKGQKEDKPTGNDTNYPFQTTFTASSLRPEAMASDSRGDTKC